MNKVGLLTLATLILTSCATPTRELILKRRQQFELDGERLEVRRIHNDVSGHQDDEVEFRESNGNCYKAMIIEEGYGYLIFKGKTYAFKYHDDRTKHDDEYITIRAQR